MFGIPPLLLTYALICTCWLKPLMPLVTTVQTAWESGATATGEGYAGESVAVKSCTASVPPEAVWTSAPLLPVTERPMLPAEPPGAETYSVVWPEPPEIVAEPKLPMKPDGRLGVRFTVPVKPFKGATET